MHSHIFCKLTHHHKEVMHLINNYDHAIPMFPLQNIDQLYCHQANEYV